MLGALLGFASLLGVAVLVVLANDRVRGAYWRKRNPPEKLRVEREARERELLTPDWDFYEGHLQRPAPTSLRQAFAERSILTFPKVVQSGDIYITSFEPLRRESLVEAGDWLGYDVVPFASSDGDLIFLKPGPSEADTIYIAYHDGGGVEPLSPDASSFFAAVREATSSAI